MEQNIEQQVTRGLGATTQSTPSVSSKKSYDFPTETITLPSQGLGYPEGHPLTKGEITIKLMTAKEEDILASPNLIKKGISMRKIGKEYGVSHRTVGNIVKKFNSLKIN